MLRLSLQSPEELNRFKDVMKNQLEEDLSDMIKFRTAQNKLHINFSQLSVFGLPQTTREIYMKLWGCPGIDCPPTMDQNQQFNLLQDITTLFVKYSMKYNFVTKKELFPPIGFNNRNGKYFNT